MYAWSKPIEKKEIEKKTPQLISLLHVINYYPSISDVWDGTSKGNAPVLPLFK